MTFEQHCQQSKQYFGSPYEHVHTWLDEFALSEKYGMRHRKVRHHLKGIKQIKEMYGNEAAEVAKMHVIEDLREEGWKEESDRFPKDEKDYVKMGLFKKY